MSSEDRIFNELSAMRKDVTTTMVTVGELKTSVNYLLARRECQSPGLCVELEKRVDVLEVDKAKVQGGFRAIHAVWAVVCGLIALFPTIKGFFSNNQP